MSAAITLVNETNDNATFGLWNAVENHSKVQKVNAQGGTVEVSMSKPDARIIGAWKDKDSLYQSNDNPFTTGAFFMDGKDYTVTLTKKGIEVKNT